MQQDEEYPWIERARQGDVLAIEWLYDRYYDGIYRYVLYKVGNVEDAEDLTAQVFLHMVESITGFHWQGSRFTSWLYRIAHNQVVDLLRRRTRRPQVALDPVAGELMAETGDPYAWAEAALLRDHLRDSVAQLTDLQGQVIALKFGGGLTSREVAEIMDRSEGAIKALQYSALHNLQKWLSQTGPTDDAPAEMGK